MENGKEGRKASLRTGRFGAVFVASIAIVAIVAIWAIIAGDSFISVANGLMSALTAHFDWVYILGADALVIFVFALAISPYGKTKLGDDDSKPTKSLPEWFALLFSAGMGVGLIFWGAAEPLSHYLSPMAGIESLTDEAMRFSLRSCFMHWGIHPWTIYAVVGLALGYFVYRLKKRTLISCTLEPLLGRQSRGIIGVIVDVYTAALIAMGVATTFGMGCIQISAGVEYLFGIPSTVYTMGLLVGVTCVVYTWSAISGVDKGMQMLSNVTMICCAALLVVVFCIGPSIDIVRGLLVGVGDWLTNFLQDSVRLASEGDATWIRAWRVYYWAWWLSWSPFVGIFLARISQGRTIRGFVAGTIVAPSILGFLWFSVFGGEALSFAQGMSAEQLAELVARPELTLFAIFSEMPFAAVLSVVALLTLFGFFVTSANSATLVISMLTSDGDQNPPKPKLILWGVLLSLIAFALIVSGGVSGIQTVTIVVSFPFFFIILAMCVSLAVGLYREHHPKEGSGAEPTNARASEQAVEEA